MGNCLCKDTPEEHEVYSGRNHADVENTLSELNVDTVASCDVTATPFKFPTSSNIDKLVLETLGVIGSLVDKWVL